ncbi:g12601 [Coccomyxa viridis]|uniref:3-ketoacyl-CoA synthase n=1 Tax=Coccomyxa viridis TaxID=1274662 RepID=A0ABP1GB29_9CHLO
MDHGGSHLQFSDIKHSVAKMPEAVQAGLRKAARTAFQSFCSYGLPLLVVALSAWTMAKALDLKSLEDLQRAIQHAKHQEFSFTLFQLLTAAGVAAAIAAAIYKYMSAASATYLVDFYSFRPPSRLETSRAALMDGCKLPENNCSPTLITFMEKVMEISGLGDRTYFHDACRRAITQKLDINMADAREESETALNVSIQHVLDRTGLRPSQIDGLIVNCTAFNPTPSLSAAVVKHFKFKSSIRTVNLSGMGCAASVISVDIARDMLKAHPGMRIIIAGTENILWNMYNGSQKSMLITNCIFRWGGFAALLSNHPADRFRAKYKLQHVVRTHLGGNEDAYNVVIQKEDEEGKVGVKIGRELMSVAATALKSNITRLAPLVLPLSEQLIFASNFVARKVLGMKLKPYVPDFTTAFEHFCIHPGGKAVIMEVGKQLKLRPEQTLPMLVPFERYGNTSSSSTWYAWSYVETFQGVKKGDRLWQLAFGSGFKCCSAVWVALKTNDEKHDAWMDVESYP